MKNYPEKRSLTILGLIFLLLTLGIAEAGYLSYRNFEEQFRVQAAGQLTAIANLKETELLNWRNERLAAEAEMLHRNFDFALHTQHYFENPDDVQVQRQLQGSLQSFLAYREYDRISLLDPAGQVRLTDSGKIMPLSAAVTESIPAVLQSKQVTIVDLYRDKADQNIYLGVLIPIMDVQTGQQVIGLVALRINPHIHFYPYLQQWPMPSTSAETLLVRREGDEVLFLNNLRFKPDAALTLRFPLEQTERPAVKAALGQTGIVEGLGYYDEPVLTDVRAVPGTPWFLIAKIDIAEAYAPLRERAWATLMFYGTLILAIGAGMALVWWQQNLRHYRQVEEVLSKKNQELQEMVGQLEQSRTMLQLVIESIPIRVFWKDKELRYLGCNSMFARDAGLSQPQQLLGKDDFVMGWKEQADLYRADDRLVMTSGQPKFNIVEPQTTPAGTTIWLNTSKVPLQNPDGEITGILGIYEDITERKQAEEALRQSEERHRIIAELATDDIYVGWLFPDGRIESEWMTGALERITGYSAEEINAWPNNLASIIIDQDLDKVMELQPRLLRHESVAVEVRIRCKNGDVRWLSNQIKPMPDKSREPAVRLLSAVQDITERKQAEEALRQNEELYRTLVEALDVSLSRWLPDTTLVFANEKYRRVFGFQNRIAGQKWVDSMPEAARKETAAFYRDLARHPHPISYERSVTTSDGSEHYYQWIDTPILDARGQAAVFQSVGFDLTERKHTEQLVQAQRDLARIIGTVTSAEDAWPLCLETVLWVSGMDSGGIYLFDAAGSTLELVFQQGLGADFVQTVSRFPINTPSAQMVLAGHPIYLTADELSSYQHHQAEGLQTLAIIPIQHQERVLGCLNVGSHTFTTFPEYSRRALEAIAVEIGNIIIHQNTEQALRTSREQLNQALLAARMGTWRLHLPTNRMEWSPESAHIFGVDYTQNDFGAVIASFHPDDRPRLAQAMQEAFALKKMLNLEYRILDANGKTVWVTNYGNIEYNADGKPLAVTGLIQDITERKLAENALIASEKKLKSLVESQSHFMVRVDMEGKYSYWNKQFEKEFGWLYEPEGIENSNVMVAVCEYHHQRVRDVVEKCIASPGQVFSVEIDKPARDSGVRTTLWEFICLTDEHNQPHEIQCMGVEITDRKKAEESLRFSEERYRQLVEQSPDVIVIDCDDKIVYVNPAGVKMAGAHHAEELIGKSALLFTPPEQLTRVADMIRQALEKGTQIPLMEDTFMRLDGSLVDVEVTSLQTTYEGKPARQVIIRDITERKQAEQARLESDERYHLLFEMMTQGVLFQDNQGRLIHANPAAEKILGLTVEHMQGRTTDAPDWPTIHEDGSEFPGIAHPVMVVLKTGQPVYNVVMGVFSPIRKSYLWVNINAVPRFRNGETKPYQVFTIIEDITERKHLETALRQNEERYRIISGAVTDYAFSTRVDENGEFVMDWVAGAFEEITGYTFEEFVARGGWQASLYPDDLYIDNHIREELVSNRSAVGEMRIFSKTGQIVHLRLYVRPVWAERENKLKAIYGAVQNITERKQAEQALRESEERLRQITSSLREVIWLRDAQTRQVLYVNPAFEELTGWTCENFYENQDILADAIYPDDRERMIKALEQRSEIMSFYQEHRLTHRDGSIRWVSSRSFPVRDTAGMVYRWVTNMEDITERKQAEADLRASEEKYRGLMESLDNAVSTVDLDGRFLYMNDMGAEKLGGKPQDFIGKTMQEIFPEPLGTRQLASIQQSFKSDQKMSFEAQSLGVEGLRWYRFALQPLHDENDIVSQVLINATDIHDLKTAQQELLELNRTLEERVKERTAQVQDLYDNAPVGYHSLDAEGRFVAINQTELNWLGYEREELLSQSITSIYTPPMAEIFRTNFARFKVTGKTSNQESEAVRKDGTTFPVMINAVAIYDEHGQYVSSRSTMTDITERKRAENKLHEREKNSQSLLRLSRRLEQAQSYADILNAAQDEVRTAIGYQSLWTYLLAEDKKFTHLLMAGGPVEDKLQSATTLSIEGDPMMEQIANTTEIVVIADARTDPRTDKKIVEMLGNRTIVNVPIILSDRNLGAVGMGTFGDEGIRVPTELDQEYLTTLASHMAVTLDRIYLLDKRKRAEDALRLSNAQLERALRVKDEFLASMSHELRTPLNAILGLSESMIEQYIGPLNDDQLLSIQTIESSGRHLLELINDILDLSKLEANQMTLDPTAVLVREVCEASLLFVRDMAHKKYIQVTSQFDPAVEYVEADERRLKQMLVNLLNNAVKFTPAGGVVQLQVAGNLAEQTVTFSVSDTGIGIAPEDLTRLFQPFVQLDSGLNRQYQGTGLGLSLVARMAELHGGTVLVESELGQGSRFTIVLPWQKLTSPPAIETDPDEPAVADSPMTFPAGRQSPLVLIAEDNEENIVMMSKYLQARGYRLAIARDGSEALEYARLKHPAVILMDLQMPVLDGLEATRRLRRENDPHIANIPVIALTALAMPADRQRSLEAGANGYLSKPVNLKQLVELINHLITEK